MSDHRIVVIKRGNQHLAIGGYRVFSLLAASLFKETAGLIEDASSDFVAKRCHDRWTDFANTIAAFPDPFELLFIIGGQPQALDNNPHLFMAFFAVGRGSSREAARHACERACQNLLTVLTTSFDYLEFEAFSDRDQLGALVRQFQRGRTLELRRRLEQVRVSHGEMVRKEIGFARSLGKVKASGSLTDGIRLDHLFGWVPSDDDWKRLIETLSAEKHPTMFVVHVQGLQRAPVGCLDQAREGLANAERIVDLQSDPTSKPHHILQLETECLQKDALLRLTMLEGRVLAARVFLHGERKPSDALTAIVATVIDDASVHAGQPGTESMFRGGARMAVVPATEMLDDLNDPTFDLLFGVTEMSAVLRTPMPTNFELPGIRINRARTASMMGRAGTDCSIGLNLHRGKDRQVALDEAARFLHTYIIGQTGTGKSTLLLNMIMHDILNGRGVGVLDPHGSLFEDVLSRIPEERAADVVLLDATDVQYPVGFNIMKIDEQDPDEYRRARDIIIDDLYSYIDRVYDLKTTGGPIFESHFRGMMAMLIGREPPPAHRVPNLTLFRAIYTNLPFRDRLARNIAGSDPVVDDFLKELTATKTQASNNEVAPYITSKFSRFISDLALRNITCQNTILDIDDIVNSGKILLMNLGKGRFGDLATGLLAGQVVSRIRLAVMKRGVSNTAMPFHLYTDEFHLFADERFSELLAEARKFRLSLTVAHQFMRQLPERVLQAVLGNVGTAIAFRVSGNDGELLETVFKPTFGHRDIASLENYHAYIRTLGAPGHHPFSLRLLPPPPPGSARRANALRRLSRQMYGRKKSLVEQEIMNNYVNFMEDRPPIPPPLPPRPKDEGSVSDAFQRLMNQQFLDDE